MKAREFWLNPYMLDFAKYDICTVEEDQGRFPVIKYIHVREVLSTKEQVGELEKMGEKYLKVIRDWKHSWMNQYQNDKEDYENYLRRAYGIDANMIHSLANKLCSIRDQELLTANEKIKGLEERVETLKDIASEIELNEYGRAVSESHDLVQKLYKEVAQLCTRNAALLEAVKDANVAINRAISAINTSVGSRPAWAHEHKIELGYGTLIQLGNARDNLDKILKQGESE